MSRATEPITVALLALPETSASVLYGFHDLLASVRRDWTLLHGGPVQASPFRPLVVSADGLPFDAANGVRITPHAGFADCERPQIAVVTDVQVAPGEDLARRDDAVGWLRTCHANGALLASACSGAVVLARTGLLDGHEGTSHWAYCDYLQRAHPATRWNADRGLVAAGAGQRILMAGSGVAWHLLVLALVARFAGAEEAMKLARINLIDVAEATPMAYASLTHGGTAADAVVAQCQQWAAQHYASEAPVAQMIRLSRLPERTFKRRFALATGMAPLEYVHHVRLEEAKQMLEAGDTPVEGIALDIGYRDSSFFSRLFRRKVGMSPLQYRQRFGRLARQLQGLAATDRPPAG
ncbi:MAG: GlxA family transcriptional regulator [Ramlibacter sp.]